MKNARRSEMDKLASSQLGLVTRAQLIDLGFHRSTVTRRVGAGALIAAGATTYRLPGAPATLESSILAACLDLDATASHLTAGWLHGRLPTITCIDVTVPKWGTPVRPVRRPGIPLDIRVHSSTNLPASDILLVRGVPTTSMARTMLGVAALVPHEVSQDQLLSLVTKSIDDRLATEAWLWWLLERRRIQGRNGVSALEAALATIAQLGPTESWLEREYLTKMARHGLPQPRTQRVIRRQGRFVARVDFSYDPEDVVVEVLGYGFHRAKEQMEADLARANEVQLTGRAILQFAAAQLIERPAMVARTVSAMLASRRAAQPAA